MLEIKSVSHKIGTDFYKKKANSRYKIVETIVS